MSKQFVTPWKHGTKERRALERYCKSRKITFEGGLDNIVSQSLINSGDLKATIEHKKRGIA